jgi:uncharacterized membrane protein YfcA
VDVADLLLASAILVVACSLQGAVGFGANLVAAPLLVLIDPVFVPGPMVVVALVLNGLMMWRDRHPTEKGHIGLALAGRLPGSILGAWLLVTIPTDDVSLFFGALVLLAVVLSVAGISLPTTRPVIAGAGALSGFMGTAIGIGGPPIALLYQHEPGPRFRAIVSRMLIYGGMISIVVLVAFGEFGRDEVIASAVVVPAVVVGFSLSGLLTGHLDRGHTRKAILAVSCLSAVAVILKALL